MTDLREFRRVCHDAARRTGGRVVEFRPAEGVTPNFHQGVLAYRDRRLSVVTPRDSPILTVCVPRSIAPSAMGPLEFVDCPELLAVLAESPRFTVLTADVLNGPFDPAEWPAVGRADIAYWQPETVGEALFNYWD